MYYQTIKSLVFTLILAFSNLCFSADPIKIGYVKVEEVIQNASISKSAEKKLRKEFAKKDAELKKLSTELKKKVEIFDRDQAILSNEEKKKVQRDLADMERDLRRKNRETKEDLNQRRSEGCGSTCIMRSMACPCVGVHRGLHTSRDTACQGQGFVSSPRVRYEILMTVVRDIASLEKLVAAAVAVLMRLLVLMSLDSG